MRFLSIISSIALLAFAHAANAQLSLDAAKGKCVELGFKAGTEQFGKCVLQLSKVEEAKPAPQQVQQIQPPPPVQTYTPPVQTYTPSQCVGDIASWNNCIGTFTLPDGGKYVGEFRDGKYHGQGTATWPSGQKYVGEFRDGKMHGQGTLTRPSGVKYVGEFRDDKMHGQGTGYHSNGSVFHSGQWLNAAPVK